MIPKEIYKSERQVFKKDFLKIKNEAINRNLLLVIDNNIDGEMKFANYTKNKLTRMLNASGTCTVFFITKDFLPLREKIKDNVLFITKK